MINKIFLITDIFPVILAFGFATNGVKRKSILRFGAIGWIGMLFINLLVTISGGEFTILTAIFESVLVFAVTGVVFGFLFRKVYKP